MINKYKDDNEQALVEMLSTYIQIGKIKEAKNYLEQVRHTFSEYKIWKRVLDVHDDVKERGLGKITKLVINNEFEEVGE